MTTRPIIVDAEEQVACPKCNRRFALSEGISRQTIERHAEAFERGLDKQKRTLEAEAAADREAPRRGRVRGAPSLARASHSQRRTSQLAKSRAEELALRQQMRELEEAKKSQELEYQRKLDAERKKIEERAGARRRRRDRPARSAVEGAARVRAARGRGPEAQARAGLAAAPGRGARAVARSAAQGRVPARRDPAGAEGRERRRPRAARALAFRLALRDDPLGSEADQGLAAGVARQAQGPAAGDRRRVRGDRHRGDAERPGSRASRSCASPTSGSRASTPRGRSPSRCATALDRDAQAAPGECRPQREGRARSTTTSAARSSRSA